MKSIAKIILCALLVLVPSTSVWAQNTLESAKEMGLIGERPDGLLGVVTSSASEGVKKMVDDINRQRQQKYADIAAKNGTSPAKVQAVAGQELMSRTPAGQYVMNAAGKWVKK